MSINVDDATKAAQQYMGLTLMKNTLQEVVGSDGMEFEIIYQALLDYMIKNSDSDILKSALSNSTSGTSNGNTTSTEELQEILNAAANLKANSTTTSSNTTGDSSLDSIYEAVNKCSAKYGVDSKLILSIIRAESDFDSTATSSVGAAGLMQIMPANYSSLGITDPYDINQNIEGGTKLFKQYLNMYNGDTEMALAAYNAGPGTLQRRGVTSSSDFYKLPSETRNYVPKVMSYYRA